MASSAQAKEFIKTIGPIIQGIALERGYKVCSAMIAQACLESAFGTSSLGKKYHNYFGMKCGSKWKGASVNLATKEEYKPGTLICVKAYFRTYENMTEGVKGYFDFISTQRYSNLKDAETPLEYLTMIKNDGYATDYRYVNKNLEIVSRYALDKWDEALDIHEDETSDGEEDS